MRRKLSVSSDRSTWDEVGKKNGFRELAARLKVSPSGQLVVSDQCVAVIRFIQMRTDFKIGRVISIRACFTSRLGISRWLTGSGIYSVSRLLPVLKRSFRLIVLSCICVIGTDLLV